MPKHKCELASSKSNLNNDNLSARDQFPSDGSLLQLRQKGSKIVVQPSVDKWRKSSWTDCGGQTRSDWSKPIPGLILIDSLRFRSLSVVPVSIICVLRNPTAGLGMVGGQALGRWIEMILYALLHLVKVEGIGTPFSYTPCQCGGRCHKIWLLTVK